MWISWTNFTSYARASGTRDVNCEKCSHRYTYELKRTVAGHASTAYHVDERGAGERAIRAAQANLEKSLKMAVNPVRCPQCGWLQADMVREVRRRRLSGLRAGAIFFLWISSLLMFLWGGMLWSDFNVHRDDWEALLLFCGVPAGLSLLVLVIRRIVVGWDDLNAGYPKRFGRSDDDVAKVT
jgi:DNA-directed RNA polymerase subunit RPC12/RpoP